MKDDVTTDLLQPTDVDEHGQLVFGHQLWRGDLAPPAAPAPVVPLDPTAPPDARVPSAATAEVLRQLGR
jgi:hypothetical protein